MGPVKYTENERYITPDPQLFRPSWGLGAVSKFKRNPCLAGFRDVFSTFFIELREIFLGSFVRVLGVNRVSLRTPPSRNAQPNPHCLLCSDT